MEDELARIRKLYKKEPYIQVYGLEEEDTVEQVSNIPVLYDHPLFDLEDSGDELVNPEILYEFESFCQGEIRYPYLQSGIEDASFIFVVYDPAIVGFAIITRESSNTFNIHSICTAKGYGAKLMDRIVELSRAYPGIRRITLESVYSAIGFYKKMGFVIYGDIDKFGETQMVRTLNGGRRKTRRMRKVTRTGRRIVV